MERLTKHHAGKKMGAYMVCCETCTEDVDDCNDCWKSYEAVNRLAAYEATMPIERAQELAQAEKDGRLVVLPCKVGDVVYEANKRGFISTYKVISIHISDCSVLIGWELIDGIYSNLNGFEVSTFGKTVFLTREDAEAALKKREAADNETD